jgi:hypothetical protein
VGAAAIHCENESCDQGNQADLGLCCEAKETCTGMTSGDGKEYCSSFTTCEHGMIADAASTECVTTCTSDLCCLQAFGKPIEKILSQPAPSDIFKAAFKIEANFEALAADETLMNKMKTAICAKFAETTGAKAAYCETVLTAGSVNAEVTFTFPADETMPAVMVTPTPDQVVATVVALPGSDSIKKGGKAISASAVQAVVFKKGQTEATPAVQTTAAPITVATTVAADTSKEDVDSAMGLSAATSFIFAVAMMTF